ncbi:ABC transporter ATP-binding protein [Actinocorallia libanotica]|uniref:ABC transporter ATP-binding protein n=1 Tax=Actinocorallia libanotica TaxID=46162 RepID=A0ABP4C2E6_9ACTN
MSAPAVRITGLTHRFGTTKALDGVDLAVEAGRIHGFLGRNGAGKTTLIRALLGLLVPDSGRVEVLGTPVRGGRTPAALWSRVGCLVEGPGLYPALSVADHLGMAARLRGLPRSAAPAVTELLDLGRYLDVPARALSLGNRQRLGLALALIHRPALVVLDEPGNGLDPAGVVDVRDLLRRLAEEGTTVFMSSHLIGEVARTADHVSIIHAGRLVAELSGAELRAPGRARLAVDFRDGEHARLAVAALAAAGIDAHADGDGLTSAAPEAVEHPDRMAVRLVEAGLPPVRLAVERDDLERHFLRLTEGARR